MKKLIFTVLILGFATTSFADEELILKLLEKVKSINFYNNINDYDESVSEAKAEINYAKKRNETSPEFIEKAEHCIRLYWTVGSFYRSSYEGKYDGISNLENLGSQCLDELYDIK